MKKEVTKAPQATAELKATVDQHTENYRNLQMEMPPRGSVMARLTSDELNNMIDLANHYDAMKNSKDVPFHQALVISKQWREAWINICRKYDINHVWPLTFDCVTGDIVISLKED